MANDYGKFQLSLKIGSHMINCCADNKEEFKQRVMDAIEIAGMLKEPEAERPMVDITNEGKKSVSVPVDCNYCGGETWDNRKDKKNPRGPDFKCRNKSCGGAAWVQKSGELSWKPGMGELPR